MRNEIGRWVRARTWRAWGMPNEVWTFPEGNRESLRDVGQRNKRTKTGGPWLSQCFPNLPMHQDGLLKVQVLGLHSQTFESEVPGMWPRNYIFKQSFQVIPGQPAWHWFMKWSMGSIALLKNAFLKSCLFMEFFLAESFVQSTRQVCYLEATSSKSPSLECFNKTNTQFECKTPDNFQ